MNKAYVISTLLQQNRVGKYCSLLIVLLSLFPFPGKGQYLSENATISLLTCSPGPDLYSSWGHSAVRVKDPANELDIVFNYGTFDFDAPNFYLNFTRGKLDYFLSIAEYRNFEYGYRMRNQSIEEQVFNLDAHQKNKLYSMLLKNLEPENKFYKYDFFFDNCATRIRDIIPAALGGDFQYNNPKEWETSGFTFRNLIDLYLVNHHWSDFGIDLVLGLPTDAVAPPNDYMFLPDYMLIAFDSATISRNGETEPFVVSKKLIVDRVDAEPDVFLITPILLCWTIFIIAIVLSYFGLKKGWNLRWFDLSFFSIIGIVGWVIFLVAWFTDHLATKDNLNNLWAVPLHFPLYIFWNKLPAMFKIYYTWVTLIINILIVLSWKFFPQNLHAAFLPLILTMIMRQLFAIRYDIEKKGINR